MGNRTQYSQDASGNVSQLHRADGTSDAFTYNSMGDLIQWTNRKGQSIALQRDANGRIVRSGTDDDQELFIYDARGNLISAENSQGKITIEYAGGYLPSKVIFPGGRFVEYEYDTHGRRTAVKDQTGRGTFYQYDNLGRLHRSLDEKGRLISAYEFNRIGMLARRELSSGTVTTYDYNRAGQLVHILTKNSDGTVLQECTYERNAGGFPVSATTPEGQWTYEYDATGQLTAARFQSASANIPDMDLRYSYDAMGNRTETRVNGAVSGYTSNSMHQYIGAGGARLDYDADGNLIEEEGSGRDREYTYDAQGRLLSVRDGDNVREYLYGALGHRIANVHNGMRTDYLIDIFRGGNVLAEFAAGNVLSSRYHYARGMESREGADGTPHFFTFDGEGSVAALLDQAGNSLNRYRYLPFGTSLVKDETVVNPYQFAGRTGTRADGEGLFWMHARFYRSDLGRFLSEDTYFEPWHNPYTYALNNPLAYHDPTGEAPRFILTTQTEEELEFGYWRDWFNNGEGKKLAAQAVADYSWSVGEYFVKGGIVAGGVYLVAASNPVGWIGIGGVAAWEVYSTWSSGTSTRKMINDIFKDRDRKKALQFFGKLKALHPEYYQDLVGGQDLEKLLKDNPAEFIKMFHQAYQELAQSRDPNQKLGPAGVGENHYVAPGALLPYRVDFENDPEASAPAQVLMISDPLSSHLDWSTLEFTEVGFGDHLIAIPGSSQSFEGVQGMRYEGVELEVAIRIALDPVNGVISAVFSTTDTATGLPPEVQYGFLPPEDETGRGQGYFAYTIRAKGDLPTGTEIRNVATITFDFGEVIDTNQVDPHDPSKGTDPEKEALVTIDAAAPTSRVDTLPGTSDASFTVQWSGEDAGSGVWPLYHLR